MYGIKLKFGIVVDYKAIVIAILGTWYVVYRQESVFRGSHLTNLRMSSVKGYSLCSVNPEQAYKIINCIAYEQMVQISNSGVPKYFKKKFSISAKTSLQNSMLFRDIKDFDSSTSGREGRG